MICRFECYYSIHTVPSPSEQEENCGDMWQLSMVRGFWFAVDRGVIFCGGCQWHGVESFETIINSDCGDPADNNKTEAYQPAVTKSPLQWRPIWEPVYVGYPGACYLPPPAFCPEMDPTE
ncbi:hypothetical protein T01_11061 [Trichinella spiralis]|uniref:Uncharacterized protein n=1 Tax=Trichinella spiralis TaxID=6334 RepID=A0A0V1BKP2_TRISP|nr:hypothetical protein T01_11061 [Trichinella spiralis]